MNRIKLFLLDLFFPNRCPVCDKIIMYDRILCNECSESVLKLVTEDEKLCKVCGKSGICNHKNLFYTRTISAFYYTGSAKIGIYSLKRTSKNFGYFIADKLSEKILSDNIMKNADFITAVPMSKQHLRERGYNHALVIAKEVSRKTGIPLIENILFKNKSEVQHLLSPEERKENVRAYYSANLNLEGKKIIICDDVLTTGCTMNKCAELLINMNAAEVYAAAGTIIKKQFQQNNNLICRNI